MQTVGIHKVVTALLYILLFDPMGTHWMTNTRMTNHHEWRLIEWQIITNGDLLTPLTHIRHSLQRWTEMDFAVKLNELLAPGNSLLLPSQILPFSKLMHLQKSESNKLWIWVCIFQSRIWVCCGALVQCAYWIPLRGPKYCIFLLAVRGFIWS